MSAWPYFLLDVLVFFTHGWDVPAARPSFLPTPTQLAERCVAAEKLGERRANRTTQLTLSPQWLDAGKQFWFRDEATGRTMLVDCTDGKMEVMQTADEARPAAAPPAGRRGRSAGSQQPGTWATLETASPDKKWLVSVRDHNLWLRAADQQSAQPLTTAGKAGAAFSRFRWSPDSQSVVALLETPGVRTEVHLLQSVVPDRFQARLRTRPYAQPGDRMTTHELHVIPLADRQPRRVEVEASDFGGPPRPRWRADGRHFLYEKTDRGHQRFRLLEVDSHTGNHRALLDLKTSTFWNQLTHYTHYVGDEAVIFASEKDGWNHLYWLDLKTAAVRPITQGNWRVRRVEAVNDEQKLLWFTASGMDADQDPYLQHWCKVHFDGTGFTRLTSANGDHRLQFSPDWKVAVASWSRVDQPPVHELRRTSDGKLLATLAKAGVERLRQAGWRPPEVFSAPGRDGVTPIWGIVFRPPDFDPAKKYPVIEHIYAGPQDSHVPKSFRPFHGEMEQLAELGFIVVMIDGMGTANRSKAFHDVCWKNLADAGFPDRMAWLRALAAKEPAVDLGRVGIYGTSAGGQSSTGAVLFHPDFYKVAVSSCGCHDNRVDKMWWNEQWMGYPVGPHYAEQSNVTHAGKLRGRLMLIVGELDTNVPPESTYRVADALIKAGKEFELVVLPGVDHTDGGPYGRRKRRDFFLRHLMGVEPPEVNAQR